MLWISIHRSMVSIRGENHLKQAIAEVPHGAKEQSSHWGVGRGVACTVTAMVLQSMEVSNGQFSSGTKVSPCWEFCRQRASHVFFYLSILVSVSLDSFCQQPSCRHSCLIVLLTNFIPEIWRILRKGILCSYSHVATLN